MNTMPQLTKAQICQAIPLLYDALEGYRNGQVAEPLMTHHNVRTARAVKALKLRGVKVDEIEAVKESMAEGGSLQEATTFECALARCVIALDAAGDPDPVAGVEARRATRHKRRKVQG